MLLLHCHDQDITCSSTYKSYTMGRVGQFWTEYGSLMYFWPTSTLGGLICLYYTIRHCREGTTMGPLGSFQAPPLELLDGRLQKITTSTLVHQKRSSVTIIYGHLLPWFL